MKEGLVILIKDTKSRDWEFRTDHKSRPNSFAKCANVHDEWQFSVHPGIAQAFGEAGDHAIRDAGVSLGLRVPMAGSFDIGNNWSETH